MDAILVAVALRSSALLSGFLIAIAALAVALDLVIRALSKVGTSSEVILCLRWAATLLLASDVVAIGLLVLAHFAHMYRQLA